MNILTVILSISECNSKYYNGRKGRTDVVFSLANYAIFFLRVNHIDGAQFIFPLLFEFHLSSDFASIGMSLNKMNFLFVIATMYSYRIKVPTNFISSTRNRIFRLFEQVTVIEMHEKLLLMKMMCKQKKRLQILSCYYFIRSRSKFLLSI